MLRYGEEIGSGSTIHIDVPMPSGVLAHRADGPTGTMVLLHNLGTEEVGKLDRLKLAGYGYRWIRIRRGQHP